MRVAFLFALSLCLFLLTGFEYAYANTNDIPTQGHEIVKAKLTSAVAFSSSFYHKNKSAPEIKEDLINIEEDEEEFVIARKHIELVNYFVTLAYASILVHFYNYLKNRLPFCKHLSYKSSYKYILQRVLRI